MNCSARYALTMFIIINSYIYFNNCISEICVFYQPSVDGSNFFPNHLVNPPFPCQIIKSFLSFHWIFVILCASRSYRYAFWSSHHNSRQPRHLLMSASVYRKNKFLFHFFIRNKNCILLRIICKIPQMSHQSQHIISTPDAGHIILKRTCHICGFYYLIRKPAVF